MPIGALALTTDLPGINKETNTCMFPCPSQFFVTVFHILCPWASKKHSSGHCCRFLQAAW